MTDSELSPAGQLLRGTLLTLSFVPRLPGLQLPFLVLAWHACSQNYKAPPRADYSKGVCAIARKTLHSGKRGRAERNIIRLASHGESHVY